MSETTSNILAQDSLSRKSLAFCGYTGYAAIILFIIGGVWLGGMLPPLLNASDTPAEVVAKVNENLLNMRVGSIFMIASFALFGTFGAGIAAQTRRFETSPVFSYTQLVFTAAGTTIALLVAFAWSLMVFRPDTYAPSILRSRARGLSSTTTDRIATATPSGALTREQHATHNQEPNTKKQRGAEHAQQCRRSA